MDKGKEETMTMGEHGEHEGRTNIITRKIRTSRNRIPTIEQPDQKRDKKCCKAKKNEK